MPETPWWESTPEGTPLLLAFVQVVREDVAEEPPQQWVRYLAGVEYVADKLGAAQPLHWRGNDVLLLIHASEPHAAITTALSAAEAIRERAMVDLSMTVRLAVHAAQVDWIPDWENLASPEVSRCEQLARTTPAQGIAITEDVYLALSDTERRRFAPLGTWVGDGLATYVFPTSLATETGSGNFQPLGVSKCWQSFRRYVDSPEVCRLRYVGFPLQKKQPPSLDIREVFIPPEVRRLATRGNEWNATAWKREGVSLPLESLARLMRRHRALVVLGDPGSGKTTVLRWLAVLAAGGPLAWAEQIGTAERMIPLLISVGRLAQLRSQLGDDCSVPHALAVYFQDRHVGDEAELRSFLEGALEAGECLLLLDGLDEVQSEERSGVLRWLETFCALYPLNRFVVSARWVGYSGFTLQESVEVELGDFQEEQIRRYVRAFERACRRWENEGTPDEAGADRDSEQLLQALFANPRLRELARNPFLLSSLALIHRAEGRLPRHRVQAYEIFARTLCETWGQARRVVASETSTRDIRYEEEAIPILGELALRLHLDWPTGVAPEDFVIRTLSQAMQERTGAGSPEAERSAREFLDRAGREVQILLERGAGQWGFLHLTFQEFFTAVGLLSAENFESVAFEHLFDPRWEEVIRLGVGYMALIQKRAQATQRFVCQVLALEASGPLQHLITPERKQIYLAALLASEAGDVLPLPLQAEIARAVVAWNQSMPETIARPLLRELALTEFAERLVDELLTRISAHEDPAREKAILALGVLRGERSHRALQLAAKARNSAIRVQVATSITIGGDPMDWETLSLLVADQEEKVRNAALAGFISSREQNRRDETLDLLLNSFRAEVLGPVIRTIVLIRALQSKRSHQGAFNPVQPKIVRHALRKGLSHEDEGVRKESLSLLSMEREHFPEEAHAHAEELEKLIASTLNSSSPPQQISLIDEERVFHERAFQGDPLLPVELMHSFANRIQAFLQHDLRCDGETAYDAVIDVMLSYLAKPNRYDPQKGRLVTYLMREAKHVVELRQSSARDGLESFVEASRALDRLLEQNRLDERDVTVLRLILSGERSTEKLAQALGLTTLSQDQMRREVKRHRDRLMRILKRFVQEESDDPV